MVRQPFHLPPPLRPRHTLAEIRERHHQMARMVASGDSDEAIAQALNHTVDFVATMRRDPSFVGLVHHYRTGEPALVVAKPKR